MLSPLSRPLVYARLCCYLGAALLIAAGCGNSSPAAGTGNGGSSAGGASATGSGGTSATGSGGSSATGSGGSSVAGTAGTTGSGGSSAAGTAGATGSGGTGVTGVGGRGGTGTGNGGVTGTAGRTGTGGTLGPNGCDPNGPQCNNCKDDDGDGKIDYDDPECVGPLDNDEGSFGTGIPGDNVDPCKQDCFFDGNSGQGDDGCTWQLKCDPLSTESKCPYDANYAASHATQCSASASQSQACIDFCRKLVPNGCDCFGCCAIPGGPTIRLASTCTAAFFNDPVKCPPCTQVTQCANTCGHCEICVGKPTLPADCGPTGTDGGTDGPPPPQCDSDYPIACGPGTNVPATGCPTGLSCITGCCGPIP